MPGGQGPAVRIAAAEKGRHRAGEGVGQGVKAGAAGAGEGGHPVFSREEGEAEAVIGAEAQGGDGLPAAGRAVSKLAEPDGRCAAGGEDLGGGRPVEEAVEGGAVFVGKVPGTGGVGRAEPLCLILGRKGAEKAELGGAGDQQEGDGAVLHRLKAAGRQHHAVGKEVGEAAHPQVPAAGQQRAEAGRVERIEPAADLPAVRQQPGRRGVRVREQSVLHGQRGEDAGGLPGAAGRVRHGQPAREGDGFLEPAGKIGAGRHGEDVPSAG